MVSIWQLGKTGKFYTMAKKKKEPFQFSAVVIPEKGRDDGDTFWVMGDLGVRTFRKIKIRLARMNAPEKDDPDPEVRKAALLSRDNLRALCLGKLVYVYSLKFDEWDRCISEVYLGEDNFTVATNLSDLQVAQGHAVYQKY